MSEIVIKFKINQYRKDGANLPPKPVKRSKYCQYLWDKATFKECDE